MAEQDRLGASAQDPFVQGDVCLHVQEDRAALGGKGLHQAHVGRVARGAKDCILSLHECSDAMLEVANNVALVMDPHTRYGVAVAAGSQSGDLTFDDVRMSGEAQIVVAADFDVAGLRRTAL